MNSILEQLFGLEQMTNIMEAFPAALSESLTMTTVAYVLFGTFVGIIVGALPGLSPSMGLTLFLPFTFTSSGMWGFFLLMGVYCGAIYGGSITAILINTPGTASSGATAVDGYQMALRGEAGRALAISTVASTVGGLISAVILLLVMPFIVLISKSFAAPEFFALGVFGLAMVTRISTSSIIKGLLSAAVGLFLSCVGQDLFTGNPRFTFDTMYLLGGISMVPTIGMYAFAVAVTAVESDGAKNKFGGEFELHNIVPSWNDIRLTWRTMLRASIVGTVIGSIPGTGGDIAAWVSYNEARRTSHRRHSFGSGIVEGVAAPEAANNAVSGGALIPLLTLGIPGEAESTVLMYAFVAQGITPSPVLFADHTTEVFVMIFALILANIALLVIGFGGMRLFARISNIPLRRLLPVVFMLCCIGAFALNKNRIDMYVLTAVGVMGFLLRRGGFSAPSLILGLIVGSIMERNLRASMVLSDGSPMIFFTRPISCILLVITVVALVLPPMRYAVREINTRVILRKHTSVRRRDY